MVDWNEVWAGLLKTAEEAGVSRYTLGERMFGKDALKRIYQKNLRVCRCMCEDLIGFINEEIKAKKLLKDKEPEVKKATKKALKDAGKKITANKSAVIEVKETTVDTIQAAIDQIKAKMIKPLIAEQAEKEKPIAEVNIEPIVAKEDEQAVVPDKEPEETKQADDEPDIAVFNIEEEPPLFVRVDKMSFLLEDYFYRLQYPFKIISGREEVDEGDHILLLIKTNGEMKPYILSADQFKEFVATGKVNHWFSARLPKELWEKMGKVEATTEQEDY